MSLPSWWSLARHNPVHEISREDAGIAPTVEQRRREDGIRDANTLTAAEALAMVQAIRGKSLRKQLPDSTPLIRADRDGRWS